MKTCTKCGKTKSLDEFGNLKRRGRQEKVPQCKQCKREYEAWYNKTHKGVVSSFIRHHRQAVKLRGISHPTYTLDELYDWCMNSNEFIRLYDDWVESGYNKDMKPSIDRLDDYKGYALDNIQVIRWDEHIQKTAEDIKSGRNTKRTRAVMCVDNKTLKKFEFYSMSEASRIMGDAVTTIYHQCAGNTISLGKYTWRYK